MSGLHEAFDEMVADVPAYGDLDRAIEQAGRERRRRHAMAGGLAAAAAVVAVIVGILAVTRGDEGSPEPIEPATPTPTRTQSARTWDDTPVRATSDVKGWDAPDPLDAVRESWFPIVAEHLAPTGRGLARSEGIFGASEFIVPNASGTFDISGRIAVIVDRDELNPFDDGCRYLRADQARRHAQDSAADDVSCSTERFTAPGGESARIASWGHPCVTDDPSCGTYLVGVAVERGDGRIGYLRVEGRGTPDANPFPRDAMAAAAADADLALPGSALAVPTDAALVSVVEEHFPRHRGEPSPSPVEHPGYAQMFGRLGPLGLSVQAWPAGPTPTCGRAWIVECVERRVFGGDDPTTVYVGSWDEEDWADCCPRNSRAFMRQLVHVGPRTTVVVTLTRIVPEGGAGIGAELDQRVIDLLLDTRLQ
ncbi:MAG TPA: hypothetical protein VNT31_14345 [Nocardioides sp.]|nr:hypothetical protein [Nocardioides sp.]